MALTHVPEGYELQLVAGEPLVSDPVAFDWGPNGELWVAEMADYPKGMDNKGKHGGRDRRCHWCRGVALYGRGGAARRRCRGHRHAHVLLPTARHHAVARLQRRQRR